MSILADYIGNCVIATWNLVDDGSYNDPEFKVIDALPSHFNTTDYVSMEEVEHFFATKHTDKQELNRYSHLVRQLPDIDIADVVDYLKRTTKQLLQGGYVAHDGENYYVVDPHTITCTISYLPNYVNLNKEFLSKYNFDEEVLG
jgi:hypothetical protein